MRTTALYVFVSIKRGVCQDRPLSPYLFILCAETITLKVNRSSVINGVVNGDCGKRILHDADCTTLLLDDARNSLSRIVDILESLRADSGLKMNSSKSHLLPLGPVSLKDLLCSDFNIEVA